MPPSGTLSGVCDSIVRANIPARNFFFWIRYFTVTANINTNA